MEQKLLRDGAGWQVGEKKKKEALKKGKITW